ncbi:hypothetical protein FACS1894176_06590 [Bacteroidia bacterium]|nr:hypothetical protein FACS189428_2240 [Clostridia bacterium]GHV26245.1 hypothetical protein FACS1894176_06590 [Bacteroidia bacterium]
MKSFSKFCFHSYAFDKKILKASFTYRFDEEFFTETVDFATPVKEVKADLDDTLIDTILKHIHIAIGISYYKLSPKAEILVPEWRDEEMLNFWKKFYLNGLGEFMVVNGLSPKEVARFKPPSVPQNFGTPSPLSGGNTTKVVAKVADSTNTSGERELHKESLLFF